MKSLGTLIRLKQEQLDEKRLVLTRLEREAAAIGAQIEALGAEVARESELAGAQAGTVFGFGGYLARARLRRGDLETRLARVNEKIAGAADAVADAFREMKRFELAQQLADQRAAAESARREQAVLDEVGMIGHRRAQH